MRIEDALLYTVLDLAQLGGCGPEKVAGGIIAGGADVVQVRLDGWQDDQVDAARQVRDVCRREDALFIVADKPELAVSLEADGLHLSAGDSSIGQARAMMGLDGLVGMSSTSLEEAGLAVEVGFDYLLHFGGIDCGAVFGGIGAYSNTLLFAASIDGLDTVRRLVELGVYRICIDCSKFNAEDLTGQLAEFSRLLGRCI